MNLVGKLLWVTCVFAISQHVESVTERDVKASISVNLPNAFKNGSLAWANYTLEFTLPILDRVYKIDLKPFYLDEHEWKESNGKYTYFVVFGPITRSHVLQLNVITADGPSTKLSKIIVDVKDDSEAKVNYTGANYGEKCTETALCVTNKTDCDQRTGLCSCRQLYQWDSTNCKYNGTDVKYGEKCNSTTRCVTPITQCDSKKGLCECGQGYYWDSTICERAVERGQPCKSSAACDTEHSECDQKTKVCECIKGYIWNWTTSICTPAKHGQPCKSSADCETEHTACVQKTKVCECIKGYHWNSTTFICTNGVIGMLVVRQEGIAMLILATLLTIFKTTPSTVD